MDQVDYHNPQNLVEALDILDAHPGLRIIAGGTDLLVLMRDRLVQPPGLISLARIEELKGAEIKDGRFEFGASFPLWRLERWSEAGRAFPALIQAVDKLAVPPIRNQATLGGNVCLDTKCLYYNQSQEWPRHIASCYKAGGQTCHVAPGSERCHAALAAETAGPLWIYGGRLTLASKGGERTVGISEFFTGDGLRPHDLAPGEIVTAVHLNKPEPLTGAAYYRFARRKALDFSQVNLTAALGLDDSGRILSARLVVGAIGPSPVEVGEDLSGLIGEMPSEETWDRAAQDAARAAVKRSRSPRWTAHLREVVRVYTGRLFQEAYQIAQRNQA